MILCMKKAKSQADDSSDATNFWNNMQVKDQWLKRQMICKRRAISCSEGKKLPLKADHQS